MVAILGRGDFFGEGCLAGQPFRMATASAMTEAVVVRIHREAMMELLHRKSIFSERFMAHLLARNVRFEEDLVDQLFNSSEKRLARVLLLLARYGKEGKIEPVVPKISQEILAEMVGTTRPADQRVHEQVPEARVHRLQRRPHRFTALFSTFSCTIGNQFHVAPRALSRTRLFNLEHFSMFKTEQISRAGSA